MSKNCFELAWRGCDSATSEITLFKKETNNIGEKTGRIHYNSLFSKNIQRDCRKLTDTKWLVKNNSDILSVGLFRPTFAQSDVYKTRR